jgi:hypothetical protein
MSAQPISTQTINQPTPGSYSFECVALIQDIEQVKQEVGAAVGLLVHNYLSDGRLYVVKASGWEEEPYDDFELSPAQGTVSWGEDSDAPGRRVLLRYCVYVLLLDPMAAQVGELVFFSEESRYFANEVGVGDTFAIAGRIFSCQVAQASINDIFYSIYKRTT